MNSVFKKMSLQQYQSILTYNPLNNGLLFSLARSTDHTPTKEVLVLAGEADGLCVLGKCLFSPKHYLLWFIV